MFNDWMSDTHVAAPHEGHVGVKGNVSPEDEARASFQPDPFEIQREEIRKALVRDAAEAFAFKVKSGALDKQADRFLRDHGARLQWKRGGKQLK